MKGHVLLMAASAWLGLLMVLSGCAPIVAHSPRIEPGGSFAIIGGWRQALCEACTAGIVPPIGSVIGYGYVPDGIAPALALHAAIPFGLFFPASQLDVFVQAPFKPPIAWGGGIQVSMNDVMVYGQFGRIADDGTGWYLTQGLVQAAYRPEPYVFLNGRRGGIFDESAMNYWSPQASYAIVFQDRLVTFFLSGAFGVQALSEYVPYQERWRRVGTAPVRALTFGLLIDSPQFRIPMF
jgi:hypothetical protein